MQYSNIPNSWRRHDKPASIPVHKLLLNYFSRALPRDRESSRVEFGRVNNCSSFSGKLRSQVLEGALSLRQDPRHVVLPRLSSRCTWSSIAVAREKTDYVHARCTRSHIRRLRRDDETAPSKASRRPSLRRVGLGVVAEPLVHPACGREYSGELSCDAGSPLSEAIGRVEEVGIRRDGAD